MKRIVPILLIVALLLCGCATTYTTDATSEDIVAVYEAAGYTVYSRNFDEATDDGIIGYVQADHANGEYIYFAIFESESAAKAYVKTMDKPFWKDLFSVEESSAETIDSYGCIVASYLNENHFYPFQGLLIEN